MAEPLSESFCVSPGLLPPPAPTAVPRARLARPLRGWAELEFRLRTVGCQLLLPPRMGFFVGAVGIVSAFHRIMMETLLTEGDPGAQHKPHSTGGTFYFCGRSYLESGWEGPAPPEWSVEPLGKEDELTDMLG